MTNDEPAVADDAKDKLVEKKLQAVLSACRLLIEPSPREITVPVSKGVVVTVRLPEKGLTAAEWKSFNAVMYQMRPALTTDDDRAALRVIIEELQQKPGVIE